MRFNSIFFLFFCFYTKLIGQTDLVKIDAKLETESYHRTLVNNGEIFFLREIESKELTEKKIILSSLDAYSLKQNWNLELTIGQFSNIQSFVYSDSALFIFMVNHNLDNKIAELQLKKISAQNGKVLIDSVVWAINIGVWQNSLGKAEVAQTFLSALDSKQNENEVTPLEYRINLSYSPDSTKVAAFLYDNSHERLYVDALVFELSTLTKVHQLKYAIDDAYLAYGAKIDNLGEIYQLKVGLSGKLAVMKVNLQNEVSDYLQIPAGSSEKVNPQLFIHQNHRVYLSYCLVKLNSLVGISITTLDFDNLTVEDSHTYMFDADFLKRQEEQLKNGNNFFELAEIEEHDNKLFLVLEQHLIEGIDVMYNPKTSEKLENWHEKFATVTTGNVLVLVYDKQLNLLNCLEIPKTQKGIIYDGLNTLGHYLAYYNNEMYFLYTKSTKGLVNDQLIVQKLDKVINTWSEYKQISLEKGHLPLVTSSCILDNKRILVHTRKGITEKDNYIKIYEY